MCCRITCKAWVTMECVGDLSQQQPVEAVVFHVFKSTHFTAWSLVSYGIVLLKVWAPFQYNKGILEIDKPVDVPPSTSGISLLYINPIPKPSMISNSQFVPNFTKMAFISWVGMFYIVAFRLLFFDYLFHKKIKQNEEGGV